MPSKQLIIGSSPIRCLIKKKIKIKIKKKIFFLPLHLLNVIKYLIPPYSLPKKKWLGFKMEKDEVESAKSVVLIG